MKNTYIKTVVIACVATLLLIGPQTRTAEAITEYQAVKGNSLLKLGQQPGITIDDIKREQNRQNTMNDTEKLLENHMKSNEVAVQSEPKKEKHKEEQQKPAVSISNEEKDLLARLVEAEAKGESEEGKVAVATVVLNRVDSPRFPNNVTKVIHQVMGGSYAFSTVQNGEIKKPASDEAIQAVNEALTRKDRLHDAIYFYNPDIATDDWIRSRTVVKTIGNHVFAK